MKAQVPRFAQVQPKLSAVFFENGFDAHFFKRTSSSCHVAAAFGQLPCRADCLIKCNLPVSAQWVV